MKECACACACMVMCACTPEGKPVSLDGISKTQSICLSSVYDNWKLTHDLEAEEVSSSFLMWLNPEGQAFDFQLSSAWRSGRFEAIPFSKHSY